MKNTFVWVILIGTSITLSCVHTQVIPDRVEIREVPVTIPSANSAVVLNGTFSYPTNVKSKSPVLMIVGSGRADRDETVPGKITATGKKEKLFKSISDKLGSDGFITLRFDKRGVLNENGDVDEKIWATADRENLIADAVSAARFLIEKTGVNVENLIILGHSEGTIIAVETAIALGGKIKKLALLGAQARPMREMLHYQIVEAPLLNNPKLVKDSLEHDFNEALEYIKTTDESLAPDGKPINWYRQFLTAASNAERIANVKGEIGIFQGKDDDQTPISELELFRNSTSKISYFEYPDLGHGFSKRKNGVRTLGPISVNVLNDISAFLSE